MSLLKEQVGKVAGPYHSNVTQEQVSLFCKAIGAKDDQIAPPTFLTTFRRGEFDLFKVLGIELSNVLHAEQEYQFDDALRAGDVMKFQTTLSNVMEKQGSSSLMQFLTFETDFESQRNSKTVQIGKAKTLIVIRQNVKKGDSNDHR